MRRWVGRHIGAARAPGLLATRRPFGAFPTRMSACSSCLGWCPDCCCRSLTTRFTAPSQDYPDAEEENEAFSLHVDRRPLLDGAARSEGAPYTEDEMEERQVPVSKHGALRGFDATPSNRFGGALKYITIINDAFNMHFINDPELRRKFTGLSWFDTPRLLNRFLKYRDKRLKAGSILPSEFFVRSSHAHETRERAAELEHFLPFAQVAYSSGVESARSALLKLGHTMVTREVSETSGLFRPIFILSFDKESKTVALSIRGTSSSDDWLTNLFIQKSNLFNAGSGEAPKPLEDTDADTVHGGIGKAARFVAFRTGDLISKVFVAAGYKVVVAGHSLGGGVAAGVAMILRREYGVGDIKAYCYAPPPAFSRALSDGSREYILSCVNNDDMISRTAVPQLKSFVGSLSMLTELSQAHKGDWAAVEQALDLLPWDKIEERMATSFSETRFDTVLPGRIILLLDEVKDSPNQPTRCRAGEIMYDSPNVRIPVLSDRMASDHGLDMYAKSLAACQQLDV